MLTRSDIAWIVALALLALVSAIIWQFDLATTIVAIAIVSIGRLAYALYARSTWRR